MYRNKKLISLLLLATLIFICSFFPTFVEKYYTYGLYPFLSKLLRLLFGWLPFSLGDLFYGIIAILLLRYIIKIIKKVRRQKINFATTKTVLQKWVTVFLVVFVLFYGLWGLNYSRVGIAGQLQLAEQKYNPADLDTLVHILHQKLNANAALITPEMRDSFKTKKQIFSGATLAYKHADKNFPFLKYSLHSLKPSVYSYLGNYAGFQGYYNPFTGEAQVNTTVPKSVEPFVATHEIAHQLGYAKESEANFVGFLACKPHPSANFRYSAYFDMYNYSMRELWLSDSVKAKNYNENLHPQVKKDIEEYRNFYRKYRNPVEPFITWLYGNYLKVNKQPKGISAYNEVVSWLIAYYKKYGKDAL